MSIKCVQRLVPTNVKVAGQTVQLVGIHQDYVHEELYITTLYVEGHIHSNSAYLVLADMPFEVLNMHTAYITDAEVIGHTVATGEFIFEYELTVRDRLPYIKGC